MSTVRRFPIFKDWTATLKIHILDDTIPEDVFRKVIEVCGLYNGFGRSRARGGGRFTVESCEIKEL